MIIHSATFVKSSANIGQFPPNNYPEYGFVGRSNVGKSSLINCLCDRKNLAKTSSTPGKTQLINHFLINEAWYLADLPGYGYAKVSKGKREGFSKLITDYVTQRKNLLNLFVLVDSRIPPQAIDLEFMEFLGVKEIPFSILLTKTDKPTQKEFSQNFKDFKNALQQTWEELPPITLTSSLSGKGREEILSLIHDTNPLFKL
ncbi:MAG: ribosome biogenesis GTP-binding protein YihA/YsxC [Bacteroidia bacterium]|nr:ribosome biogenesis GTP-binding protein YihA/YsxC [Bacteroidia bacterium]